MSEASLAWTRGRDNRVDAASQLAQLGDRRLELAGGLLEQQRGGRFGAPLRQLASALGEGHQVAPATGNSECTFTLKLPAGQITILGGYGKGINAERVVHEAVGGGTGAYDDARGQTTSRETGRTTEDLRITLR